MRTVRLHPEKFTFQVSDDNDYVIGSFLAYATTEGEAQPADFEPGGDGYVLGGILCAYQSEEPEDIPANHRDEIPAGEDEIWIISRTRRRSAPDTAWLTGEEIRTLFNDALRMITAVREQRKKNDT